MEIVNVDHEYIPMINGNSFYPNVFWTYAHYIQTISIQVASALVKYHFFIPHHGLRFYHKLIELVRDVLL